MDLVIFDSTSLAMAEKHIATITISDFDKSMNKFSIRGALSIKRYRTVLFNSAYDIDISDCPTHRGRRSARPTIASPIPSSPSAAKPSR